MIARWKIAREVRRIVVRAQGVVNAPIETVRRALHERSPKRSRTLDALEIGQSAHVAILAIFQPGGLSESTFATLQHLVQQGYAPIVASNAPLSKIDLNRLQQHAIFVYERCNFGYDFGAFQDIINALSDKRVSLKSLILVNDSVWFPVKENSSLISEMKDHPASVVAAQMFGSVADGSATKKDNAPILGSYLMMFKQDALASKAFGDFWRDYRMSSNKEVTIRRGERGLSAALHRDGLHLGGIYSLDRLDDAVARLSKTELLEGLRNSILLKPKDRRKRFALLASETCDARWRDDARRFMSEMARRKNMIGVHPKFCFDQLGIEIVKKNSEMHYRLARQQLSLQLCQGANSLQLSPFKEELAIMALKDALPKGLYAASLGCTLPSEPKLRLHARSTEMNRRQTSRSKLGFAVNFWALLVKHFV